ncbi:MAG: terminase family protein [Bryobacterales bacterium]|nr:terminase family protein [Bryobacterales bacterium]
MKTRFKGFSGPIGSGKSAALCHEAIRLAYQNPGCMGLLGAPTYPMLRDATRRALLGVLEENEIPYEWHRSENYIDLPQCKSRVLLRSLDEYERLRGTNLAWFGVDELTYCKEEAWLRLEGRLREPKARRPCGFGVWTPKGTDWVHRRFLASEAKDYEVVLAKPSENRHVLAADPQFYERLKSTYSDAFYRQEVLGEYVLSNGRQVYSSFNRETNIKPLERIFSLPLLWTLDFNVSPFCTLICQRVGNSIHVLDELVLIRAETVEMAREMNDKYGQKAHGLVIYGDATGSAQHTNGPSNYKQLLAELGNDKWKWVHSRVKKSNPPVNDRIRLVNNMLKSADAQVRIQIDPRCHWLIADLEQVQYQEDGVRVDKASDANRTHISDALGYLVWQEFGVKQQIGERQAPVRGPGLF